jgi:hypothetical protein
MRTEKCVNYKGNLKRNMNIMATNLALDDRLLETALKIGGLKTKKDTVNAALKEFVERRKQKEIIALFGSMPNDEDYDYKKARA